MAQTAHTSTGQVSQISLILNFEISKPNSCCEMYVSKNLNNSLAFFLVINPSRKSFGVGG